MTATTSLAQVLQHPAIWRGHGCASGQDACPSGFDALDRVFPGGGWPRGALTEIFHGAEGIGELSLVMPALARVSREGRQVVLVAPPHIPYAPALAAHGLDTTQLLLVRAVSPKDRLWALEQALASERCGAALAWPGPPEDRAARRLQLACERGRGLAFLFMHTTRAPTVSPAALRLALAPLDDGLEVRVLKRRGGGLTQPVVLDARARTAPGTVPPLPGRTRSATDVHA